MKQYKYLLSLFGILLIPSILLINAAVIEESATMENKSENHKIFELRTYTTYEGKLDELHQRFANHTMKIFEKHGINNIGYWIPVDKNNTLIYIISHESREAAEKNWDAFIADPEWQRVYEESRADGPIVENIESVFMKSTEYSPLK